MVRYCSAFNCTNSALIPGISFHKFPANPKLRKEWVIKMKREYFVPTQHSTVCSDHFTLDSFTKDSDPVFRKSLGLPDQHKRKLREGAVPTLFYHNTKRSSTSDLASSSTITGDGIVDHGGLSAWPSTTEGVKRRRVVDKLEHKRVSILIIGI